MKKRFYKCLAEYLLLLFLIICLITAGVIISDLVLHVAKPFVNPAAYPITEDTGVLSDKQVEVYHSILAAVDSGSCTVSVPKMMDYEKNEITVQLGLHYGTMERVFSLVSWGEDTAALDLILFSEFEEQKIVVDAKIDEALRNLYEGSDRFKLWQICNYIANRISYTDGVRETVDGFNGKGMCCTYSMLFYKMATRLGIQTYICYGFTDDSPDSYHSWSMVVLDGKQYFYDPTWYDNIVSDFRYVHSETPWGRSFTINRK